MNINKIVDLYKRHRMTQEELAEKINMSKTNLSNIILGKQEAKVSTIEAIAKYFKVPVGCFFEECEATGIDINKSNIVQNVNGCYIKQTIGEQECRKELEELRKELMEARKKIIELQDKLLSGGLR